MKPFRVGKISGTENGYTLYLCPFPQTLKTYVSARSTGKSGVDVQVSKKTHDWLILLLPSMPENIQSNKQHTSDNDIRSPLPAHFHDFVSVISDKIPNVSKNPHPDSGAECSVKTEF